MSLSELRTLDVPAWLDKLSPQAIREEPIPLQNLLADSLFYPACGFDGDPVKHLGGTIYSFIYVDFGHTHSQWLSELKNPGFRGYMPLENRVVNIEELISPDRLAPTTPEELSGEVSHHDRNHRSRYRTGGFCVWSVFQRQEGYRPSHEPERLSLLFLCAEGLDAFNSLYTANSISPKAIAIIQPGHGFGRNWTNFEHPEGPLAKAVLGNPAGRPEILLFGGIGKRQFYRETCWPEYNRRLCFLQRADGSVGVWLRE